MGYVSYLQFFTEMKQLIRDCHIEFSTAPYQAYSDNEFNIKYKTFLTRIQRRCKDYSDAWFFGPSKYVNQYVEDIMCTKDYPRKERFHKLLELTDSYMRGSMT